MRWSVTVANRQSVWVNIADGCGGFCSLVCRDVKWCVLRIGCIVHRSDANAYALHALMHVAPVRRHPIHKLLPPQACTHACSHALWHPRVLAYTHARIHPRTSGSHSAVCMAMWRTLFGALTGGAKPISSASLSSAVACVPSASRSITCAAMRCTEGLLHRVVCCTLHRGSVAFSGTALRALTVRSRSSSCHSVSSVACRRSTATSTNRTSEYCLRRL